MKEYLLGTRYPVWKRSNVVEDGIMRIMQDASICLLQPFEVV